MFRRLPRIVRRIAAAPLFHFLVLGALIFWGYALTHPQAGREVDIVVNDTELARLRAEARAQWGQEPSPEQLQGLVEAFVHEEVLVREALALGLDRDDTVIRRRLAQKMEFLAQQDVRSASEAEVQAWFESHAADYQTAERIRWEQRYFTGPQARQRATEALHALRAGADRAGDRFMLATNPGVGDRMAMARDYGEAFARAAWNLPLQTWTGPIESPHGVHLVRVLERMPARPAELAQVHDRVAADLLNHRIAQAREAAYQAALARYRLRLPPGLSVTGRATSLPQP